jgi:putative endonuclease
MSNKISNRKKGDITEERATLFLEKEGFTIVERNYYARKLGEIDIIASKEGVLHFVEVKSATKDFEPLYNLTRTKLRRVIQATYYYLKQKRLEMPFSIDALVIRSEEVELIENITL